MQIPEIILAGPDSIAASVPYILGFTPRESLVVMWLRGSVVRLTMRVDLPPEESSSKDWVDLVVGHSQPDDGVIICVIAKFGSGTDADVRQLPSRALVTDLISGLEAIPCRLHDALLVNDSHWWSYLCEELECCPATGTPIDESTATEVAARFALVGVASLPDRESVLAVCADDPLRRKSMEPRVRLIRKVRTRRISSAADPHAEIEAWRDEAIAHSLAHLANQPGARSEREEATADAATLDALGDIRVRDTVLWEIAQARALDSHAAFESAARILRAAPARLVAPIGTLAAILAWLNGDGVRAGAALDRVREADPDYVLADLLWQSLRAGLPPASWREMMRNLSRAACRGAECTQ